MVNPNKRHYFQADSYESNYCKCGKWSLDPIHNDPMRVATRVAVGIADKQSGIKHKGLVPPVPEWD